MTTLLERDIQDIAQIEQLSKIPQRLSIAASLQSTLTRLTPELTLTQRTRFGATLETWVYGELRRLRELVGPPFVTGIVLYDGALALSFGDGLWAVPLNRL